MGGGFFGVAMGALWAEDGKIKDVIYGPHFQPKAKSVIFLFMCGGISHIDTFDPKDNKYAGKLIDAVGFGDNVAEMKRPVIPILRTFTNYGNPAFPCPIGSPTSAASSTTLPSCAPCGATRATTSRPSSKPLPDTAAASSITPCWAPG
jgi:hypothetical protein